MPDIYVAPTISHLKPSQRRQLSPLHSLFASFVHHPSNVTFETQEADEHILLFMRAHWVTNIPWVITAIIIAIAPLFLGPFFASMHILPEAPISYPIILTFFWYVGTLGFIMANFMLWYFNVYIITNKRVIDVDFIGLLYKEFSATSLRNIEDITNKQGGFFSSVFNYGNVYIQTAGAEPNFDFVAVPQPDKLVKTIWEIVSTYAPRRRGVNE